MLDTGCKTLEFFCTISLLEPISKMGLSPHGGVADRLKMLTYSRVCCAFSLPAPCPEP